MTRCPPLLCSPSQLTCIVLQLYWHETRPASPAPPRLWEFLFRQPELPAYQQGDLVGVKSKEIVKYPVKTKNFKLYHVLYS